MRLFSDITVYGNRVTWTYRLVTISSIRRYINSMINDEILLECLPSLTMAALTF